MTIDTLTAFVTTPEFFSGLTTGALISKTVRKTAAKLVREKVGNGGGS